MSRNVYVFAEQRDGNIQKVAYELVGKARELADTLEEKVYAVLVGQNMNEKAGSLIEAGADGVVLVQDEMLAEYTTEAYAKAVVAVIKEKDPEIFLIGATAIGRDLAPRVSARIHTGLTADCTGLAIDEGSKNLLMTRPAFGGNLMASILCPYRRPQMATVRPKIFPVPAPDPSRTGTIEHIPAPGFDGTIPSMLFEIFDDNEEINIADAQIVIGVGKGIGGIQGIRLAEDLAKTIGGVVAASRAVVDTGWLPYSRQVGQTGKTISPKLYIACGISGAIQHVVGLANVKTIVAINKDPDAPIFQSAHYGIVGDCTRVIPAIAEHIKAIKKR